MQAFACVAGQCIAAASVHYAFIALGAIMPMAPPRDTAGTHQPQQADAGRYNQKSTTFRNGTTEEGWFYPTPAALKAAADVRGTRTVSSSEYGASIDLRPRAQATRKPITRTSSSIRTTRTAWCTASEGARVPPRLTCVCDPQRSRGHLPEDYEGLSASPVRGFARVVGIAR